MGSELFLYTGTGSSWNMMEISVLMLVGESPAMDAIIIAARKLAAGKREYWA